MNATAMHPLAVDYLRRLRHAGRELPAGRLDDLCAEIESHLAEAIPAGAPDADALSVIDRLGPPEEIVEAEQPATAPPPGERRSWRETAAVVLLLLGGFAFLVGWLVGVVLLWTSRAWTMRDKLIGTLIVPGGLAAVFPMLFVAGTATKRLCRGIATQESPVFRPGSMHCVTVGGPSTGHTILGVALIVIAIVGPIATAIYLSRRAGAHATA